MAECQCSEKVQLNQVKGRKEVLKLNENFTHADKVVNKLLVDLLNVPDCLLCGSAWVIRSVVDIIIGWWTLLNYHLRVSELKCVPPVTA